MALEANKGIIFNGNSTDYAKINKSSSLDGSTEFTLEISVTIPYYSGMPNMKIVSRRLGTSFIILGLTGGNYYCGVANGNVSNFIITSSTPPSGFMETLKMTFKNSDQMLYLYKNNVLIASGRMDGLIPDLSTRDLYIGASQDSGETPTAFLKGRVHQLTLSNQNGLLANYLCNEGTGTTLTDTSGNNNHGTITGATWAVKKAGTTKAAPTKANKNWVKPLSSGYGISGTNPVFPSNYTVTHTAIGQYKGLSKAFTNDEVAYLRGKTVTFGAEYLTGTDSNHIVQLNVTTPAGNAYIGGHYTPAAGYRTYTLPLDLTGLGFSIQVQIVGDGSITYECRNPFLVVGSSYDGVFEAYRSVSDVKSASLTLTVVR